MTDKTFTLYYNNYREEAAECIYPYIKEIRSKKDLSDVMLYDHVCAEYKGNHRSVDNFQYANCTMFDIDNSDTDDANKWIHPDDLRIAFPNVPFYISYSRNHMKTKNGKAPRPKFHVYFPDKGFSDAKEYTEYKKKVFRYFSAFDKNALDAARPFFGVETPNVEYYDGDILLFDFMKNIPDIPPTDADGEGINQLEQRFDMSDTSNDIIPEGQRNSTLYRFAVKTLKREGDNDNARQLFFKEAGKCVPPLENKELNEILHSALKIYNTKIKVATDYIEPEQFKHLVDSKKKTQYDNKTAKPQKQIKIISAPDLQIQDFPPTQFFVDGFLPEGISILSAPSKIGKSWFVLDMGLRIASGESFFNKQTNQAGVLYFALEDSYSRLKSRMNKVIGNSPAPDLFMFANDVYTLDNCFLENLDEIIKKNPEIKLIIIDTLQKIRGQALPRETAYQQDYREIGQIKEYASKMGISVLFVHHNRKLKDEDDPFNMISGTNGIMGAADTIFVITKGARNDANATLHITGRDVEQNDIVITFDQKSCRWKVVGDAVSVREEEERQSYQSNTIVKAIKQLLRQSPDGKWKGTAKLIQQEIEKSFSSAPPFTPQRIGKELHNLKSQFSKYDGIIYESTSNGNAGKIHHFSWEKTVDLPDYTVDENQLPIGVHTPVKLLPSLKIEKDEEDYDDDDVEF